MNPIAAVAVTTATIGLAIAGAYALTGWASRHLLALLTEALDEAHTDWALIDELRTLTGEPA